MQLYYSPDIANTKTLPDGESLHCVKVMRKKEGDEILVADGTGKLYKCRIEKADSRKTILEILETIEYEPKRNYKIILAIAPTKNFERTEWAIEKAIEIGVDEINLLLCEHNERKEVKRERVLRLMIAAMKQSLNYKMPVLEVMTSFSDFISKNNDYPQKFFGYCGNSTSKQMLSTQLHPEKDVAIMIGPEGDFSEKEVSKAISMGWLPVSLGDTRLRTETAGVVAVSTIETVNQIYNFQKDKGKLVLKNN